MGIFGSREKKIIDYTQGYKFSQRKNKEKEDAIKSSTSNSTLEKNPDSSGFVQLGFFSDSASAQKETSSENSFEGTDALERRKKLAKRLVDMTDKIEDLSNQIYHLQQRLELLERKITPSDTVFPTDF
jgi:hypothetical protein